MFQKPTEKTATNPLIMAGSFVVGAKVGDGVAAVMPESTQKYKRWILGILSIGLAACVKTTTTTGVAAQAALVGMAAKQVYDEVNGMLTESVDVQDSSTPTGKFLNAVIGHKEEVAGLGYTDNIFDWKTGDENALDFSRMNNQQIPAFTGVS